MEVDEQTSRLRFLKQLGIGLAVGIGAAALPSRGSARPASPDGVWQCCASTQHCSQNCGGNDKDYWCDCQSFFYCTGCRPWQGACFTAAC
jgi:hypothetical protein